jgi:nucleoside-diphosphate-sugar epimerase
MSITRVAVLGATGHVGKVLTAGLASTAGIRVTALARSMERLTAFLEAEGIRGEVDAADISLLEGGAFDAVIDCTGIGAPDRFGPNASELIAVQEHFDRVTLEYLEAHPGCRLVCMSSGAAYLSGFHSPAGPDHLARLRPDQVGAKDAYGVVKAASEARHRLAPELPIVDLRLFGLFSPYLDLSGHYLLSQAMTALLSGEVLVTDEADVVRDYAHPADLTALVAAVIAAPPVNRALDVYSAAPASKREILEALAEHHGLRYEVRRDHDAAAATGRKPLYYSIDRAAESYGYRPRYTTLECVLEVAGTILGAQPRGEEESRHA